MSKIYFNKYIKTRQVLEKILLKCKFFKGRNLENQVKFTSSIM